MKITSSGRALDDAMKSGMLAVSVVLALGAPLSHASQSLPASLPELVKDAEYIFKGTVVDVQNRLSEAQDPKQRVPYTFITYIVEHEYKGTSRSDTFTLRFLGGDTASDLSLALQGAPKMQVGDEDTLFVKGNGESVCPLSRCAQGRFREVGGLIVDELGRPVISGENNDHVSDSSEVSANNDNAPLATLSPESFSSKLTEIVSEIYEEQALTALPIARNVDSNLPFVDTFISRPSVAPPPIGLASEPLPVEDTTNFSGSHAPSTSPAAINQHRALVGTPAKTSDASMVVTEESERQPSSPTAMRSASTWSWSTWTFGGMLISILSVFLIWTRRR